MTIEQILLRVGVKHRMVGNSYFISRDQVNVSRNKEIIVMDRSKDYPIEEGNYMIIFTDELDDDNLEDRILEFLSNYGT